MAAFIVMLSMISFMWIWLGIPSILFDIPFLLVMSLFLCISFSFIFIVMLIRFLPFHTFLFTFSDKGLKIIVQDRLYFKYRWDEIKKIEIKRVTYFSADDKTEDSKRYDKEITLHTQEGGMKRFYLRLFLHTKKHAEEAITSIKYYANLKEIEIYIEPPSKKRIPSRDRVPDNIIERYYRDLKRHIKRSIKNKKKANAL